MIDFITYQRRKAQRVQKAILSPATQKTVVEEYEGTEVIDKMADAYGYLNGIDFESVGNGEIPARSADRIFLAMDALKEALAGLNIRINNYKING